MIFCFKCFKDYEVQSMIKSAGQVGNCEICESDDISIYNTDIDDYLMEYFEELLDIYETEKIIPDSFPRIMLKHVKDILWEDWNIFSENLDNNSVDRIIRNICKHKMIDEPEYFDERVGLPEAVSDVYLNTNSIVRNKTWSEFVVSIKEQNRFHSNIFNGKAFEVFCSYITKTYKKGHMFYRSRISSESGYPIGEMSAPPPYLASAGRANPEGISYLYLGDSIKTTIHEIKAGQYDYVSAGCFVLERDIKVVDLTEIDNISAFSDLDFKQHAINRDHLIRINDEIAKPLRRHDSKLDYLPTQYICDFIKSIQSADKQEYDGIKYRSTMNKSGYNIALFDKELCICTQVQSIDIKEIKYEFE